MSSDAARQPSQPTLIKTPDQLQQAQQAQQAQRSGRSEGERLSPRGGRGREPDGTPPAREGVLGQLETERGHD